MTGYSSETLTFGASGVSIWGGHALDSTYNLVNWSVGDAGSFDPSFAGVGLSFDWLYNANFGLAASFKWDLGSAAIGYELKNGIDLPALFLNEAVRFDTSGWSQTSSRLNTTGLDWANFQFDLNMSYGASVGFNNVSFTLGGADIISSGPISLFNLPQTTQSLASFNLGNVVNGTIPYYYDSGFIDIGFDLPTDPLTVSDSAGALTGAVSTLGGATQYANPLFSAGIDLDRILGAMFPAIPLGIQLDPVAGVNLGADLVDATGQLDFNVKQDLSFTPDPVKVTLEVYDRNNLIQTLNGKLGDDLEIKTPTTEGFGELRVIATYEMSGVLKNTTSLALSGQLLIDFLKAHITYGPATKVWGPWAQYASPNWELMSFKLFEKSYQVDLGEAYGDYKIDWENFYTGTAGIDKIQLTPHQVEFDGLGGDDVIAGNNLDNTIRGGEGDDSIVGVKGDDILDGGEGDRDLLSYSSEFQLSSGPTTRVFVNLGGADATFGGVTVGAGKALDSYGFTDTVSNFEIVYGGRRDDVLFAAASGTELNGGLGNDHLFGNLGRDNLLGRAGDDELSGGGGDDILNGWLGLDTLDGGAGANDLASYADDDASKADFDAEYDPAGRQATGVAVNLGAALWSGLVAGTARDGYGNIETLIAIEGAIGSKFADSFLGGAIANTFRGGAGDDLLDGGAGDDLLVGGVGNDTYHVDTLGDTVDETADEGSGTDLVVASLSYSIAPFAGVENLTIIGGAIDATGNGLGNIITGTDAANTLDGGAGDDTLVGGEGGDTYLFDSLGDTVTETADASGARDHIRLSVAGLGAGGTLNLETWGAEVEDVSLDGEGVALNVTANGLGNIIEGNSRDNTVNARGGNDTIFANGGQDIVNGEGGDDLAFFTFPDTATESAFHGGAGTDTLVLDYSGVTAAPRPGEAGISFTVFNSPDGNVANYRAGDFASLFYFTGVERFVVTGTKFRDYIRGGSGDDILKGGEGNDTLNGYGGKDRFDGGAGLDIAANVKVATTAGKNFVLNLAATQGAEVVVNAGTDIETRWKDMELFEIATGSGDDSIDARGLSGGIEFKRTFDAGSGDDTFAFDAASTMMVDFKGGAGTDTMIADFTNASTAAAMSQGYIQVGNAVSNSGLPNAKFYNSVERFQLTGSRFDDVLSGDKLDDVLRGGDGDDLLYGRDGQGLYYFDPTGSDTFDGGAGFDRVQKTYVGSQLGKDFSLTLKATQAGEVVVNAGTAIETRWKSIESVQLTTGAGNDFLDVRGIVGTAENQFDAGTGDDTFALDLGTRGDSVFNGRAGTDTLIADFSASATGIVYAPFNGINESYGFTVGGTAYTHTDLGVERFDLTGSAFDDELQGGALDDVLKGGAGNDTLRGLAGKGTYHGGSGSDLVTATVDSTAANRFVLALKATQAGEVVVNAGTVAETRWQGIESVELATGAGADGLDIRGVASTRKTTFSAGAGADTFSFDTGASGGASFDGGADSDTLIADFSTSAVGISSGFRSFSAFLPDNSFVQWSYANVERVEVTGSGKSDWLDADGAVNVLRGGAGDDSYLVEGAGDIVDETGGSGIDTVYAYADVDLGDASRFKGAIENVRLGGSARVAKGNGGDNLIVGNALDNTLTGDGGADRFTYTGGTDAITDFRTGVDKLEGAAFSALASLEDLLALVDRANTASAVITFSAGNSLTLQGVDWRTLQSKDIAAIVPVLQSPISDQSVAEDSAIRLVVPAGTFSAPAGAALTLSAALADGRPLSSVGLAFDPASGVITGSLPANFNGAFDIKVTAASGKTKVSDTFKLTLTPVPDAPVLSGARASLPAGSEDTGYVVRASDLLAGFTDPDRDTLSVMNLSASQGTIKANGNGTYTLTPPPDFAGKVTLSYNVSDGRAALATAAAVTFTAVNDAPVIAPIRQKLPVEIKENTKSVLKLSASDVDAGATLSWSIVKDPKMKDNAFFTIDGNGQLSFKSAPDFEAPRDGNKDNLYSVSVMVSDGQLADTQTIGVKVVNVAGKPLTGSAKADTLVGTIEEERIAGKGGPDTLKGVDGADTFVFDTKLDPKPDPKKPGFAKIVDFDGDDKIELGSRFFAVGKAKTWLDGDLFKDFAQKGAKVEKDDRILYNSKTGVLSYDADGSGKKHAAIQFADIDNLAKLSADDFWIA